MFFFLSFVNHSSRQTQSMHLQFSSWNFAKNHTSSAIGTCTWNHFDPDLIKVATLTQCSSWVFIYPSYPIQRTHYLHVEPIYSTLINISQINKYVYYNKKKNVPLVECCGFWIQVLYIHVYLHIDPQMSFWKPWPVLIINSFWMIMFTTKLSKQFQIFLKVF